MLRMYDGFQHWQPGGIGITLPAVAGATSQVSDGAQQLNHFWTGTGGTVATSTGELVLSGTNPYLFVTLDSQTSWVVGFKFKQATLFSGWGAGLLRIRDCAVFNDLLVLAVESTGKLSIYAGNQEVLLAQTPSAVIVAATYYYVEFKVFADGTTWSVQVRLNGIIQSALTVSGTGPLSALVADAYGAANLNQIMLAGARTFDNFYALDGQTAGDGLVDFLNPCVVEFWLPTTDSDTGTMTYAAGTPPNTGTYGFTAWGITSTPSTIGTGHTGNQLAAIVNKQYAIGDTSYIGTAMTSAAGNPQLVMAGWAPLTSLSGGLIYGVSPFAVCKGSGATTLNMTLGAHVSNPLPPFFGYRVDGSYATSNVNWNLLYLSSLSGGYGTIAPENGDGRAWDATTLPATQWHLGGITGTPGSIKITQFGLLVLRTIGASWPVSATSRYVDTAVPGPRPVGGIQSTSAYNFSVSALSIIDVNWKFVAAYSSYRLTAQMQLDLLDLHVGTGFVNYQFIPEATAFRVISVAASSAPFWTPNATGGRDIHVFASTGYGMSVLQEGHDTTVWADASDIYQMVSIASSLITGPYASGLYLLSVGAFASLFSPTDQTIPQTSDIAAGPQIVLYSGLSRDFPLCFAEASNGTVLAANGIDFMLRWDAFSSYAERAGVDAPGSAVTAWGEDQGLLVGKRYAIQRFFDRHGNISNPGPISDSFFLGTSGAIIGATVAEDGTITLFARNHALSSGDVVMVGALVGIPANGVSAITVIDQDHFTLVGVMASPESTLKNAGYWIKGVAQVNYIAPAPLDPKVVRRQILRTLDGNATVFYVDVDTTDVAGTEFSSMLDDQVLSGQEAVPFVYDDQMPAAYRYGVPPSHKSTLVYHLGRVFAAVDQIYSQGTVEVQMGSSIVHGVGVNWPQSFVGRLLTVEGASRHYSIQEVRLGQFLILDQPYADQSNLFALYTIRPSDVERRLVYFSEPNNPEAWPPWNAFSVPEHSDELTGMVVMGSFLYLVENRHINSFAFKSDPGRDGFTFLKSDRGCVNNRCLAAVEDVVYMLDEAGIHRFNGEHSEHISSKIHNLFNDPNYPYRVDWAADRTLWHACVDSINEIIRWFIDLQGQEKLTHAICYDYRRDRFWLESYGEAVTASASATLGYRRVLAGTTARRVIVLDEGTLDGVSGDLGTISGTVFQSTPTSISIDPASATSLPENVTGIPVVITSGAAKGQRSVVSASIDRTIEVVKAFPIQPIAGDTFTLGAIPWIWQGTPLPYVDQESDNPRSLAVVFKPTISASWFDMRAYFDYADEPRDWGVTRNLDGVATIAGSPDIVIDTQRVRGYAIQHIAGRRAVGQITTDFFVKIELQGVQAIEPTRIFQVIISGAWWQGGGQEAVDVRAGGGRG